MNRVFLLGSENTAIQELLEAEGLAWTYAVSGASENRRVAPGDEAIGWYDRNSHAIRTDRPEELVTVGVAGPWGEPDVAPDPEGNLMSASLIGAMLVWFARNFVLDELSAQSAFSWGIWDNSDAVPSNGVGEFARLVSSGENGDWESGLSGGQSQWGLSWDPYDGNLCWEVVNPEHTYAAAEELVARMNASGSLEEVEALAQKAGLAPCVQAHVQERMREIWEPGQQGFQFQTWGWMELVIAPGATKGWHI